MTFLRLGLPHRRQLRSRSLEILDQLQQRVRWEGDVGISENEHFGSDTAQGLVYRLTLAAPDWLSYQSQIDRAPMLLCKSVDDASGFIAGRAVNHQHLKLISWIVKLENVFELLADH